MVSYIAAFRYGTLPVELVASVEVCLQIVTESVEVDEEVFSIATDGVFPSTIWEAIVNDDASLQIICGRTGELVSATDVAFPLVKAQASL